MKILVLYTKDSYQIRKTIDEHLYSFKRFAPEHDYYYVNVVTTIPSFLFGKTFDLIILHYTFLGGPRFEKSDVRWLRKVEGLENIIGTKIAIPQDEYDCTARLCDLFLKTGVKVIFTCFELPEDIKKAYNKSGTQHFSVVFTGYVDELLSSKLLPRLSGYKDRPIDIGYRARKLPANFGKHAQLKYELVKVFNENERVKLLKTDISSAGDSNWQQSRNVKLGGAWNEFLMSCKAFIGCEGGSSLLDPYGIIKERVNTYETDHPSASFEEIETACFPGEDFNIKCFALSPRHFEAAMTKTLQILVEGNYGGIFLPDVHYLCLKKDFSNLEQIIDNLGNTELCQAIIDRAYHEIVLSKKYTYKAFVDAVLSGSAEHVQQQKSVSGDYNLKLDIITHNMWITLKLTARHSFYVTLYTTYQKYFKSSYE